MIESRKDKEMSFVLGLFVGCAIGFFLAALCRSASSYSREGENENE